MSEHRPDPDALLRRVQADEARRGRARLKVFLGYAAGVGKTYKMLELAVAQAAQGVDVVIGLAETHNRYETGAMLLGLELLPRRRVPYKGTVLEELDLEAALARRPRVILVDELAHTNAPGGLHAKRWQDVLDLLDAGIEVHTTVNVQHVESLNDVVAQITHIRVRETVPDAILARADEIELVDCPSEELLRRLAEGKVYLAEQAARASEHFFRLGNLLALRELAMRVATRHVDEHVREYRQEHGVQSIWPSGERLLVCVGPAPGSARLVRAASRIAGDLRAPWIAAYVEGGAGPPLGGADRERLESHLRLAESLGAEVVRLTGASLGAAIVEHSRKHNVTRIVIGKPTRSRFRDLVFGSPLEDVVRQSGDIDILAISSAEGSGSEPVAATSGRPIRWKGHLRAAALVGLATAGMLATGSFLSLPELVMLYLLVTMLVAVIDGYGPSLVAIALSVAAYDFCFIPPYFTFSVADARHVLTFFLMLAIGQILSGMVVYIRRQREDSRVREERTAVLHSLGRDLGSAIDREQIALVIAQHATDVFEAGAAVLLVGDEGRLAPVTRAGPDVALEAAELSVARWVFEHGRPAGAGTETLPGARVTCWPLDTGTELVGVLALALPPGMRLEADIRHFLESFLRQSALALEREHLADEAKSAALRARTEEMRSSILTAVSHDLRTPLAVITGAATTLRDTTSELPREQRRELLESICEETRRMERLVRNLLDMTRLASGALEVSREWVPLEEVVGSALTRLESSLLNRAVTARFPPELPLLAVDPVLMEQVFVNLVENAVKYSPAGSPIELGARRETDAVVVEVLDRGIGLPPGTEERVFEKFYRGQHPGVVGAGLGLSVSLGIVQAHGGTLTASSRTGGGACFTVWLSVKREPPPVPEEAEMVP